jgi:DNA-binding GntR family transcriptional regulator
MPFAQPIGVLAPPPSRTDFVLQTIKEAILAGELSPGQPLVESELAARLAVSKTPVREALKTLAGTGLVVMSTYKGASVAVLDRELLRSVAEVRAVLEPAALRLAIAGDARFDEAAAALAAAAAASESSGPTPPGPVERASRVRMSLANRRFHQALYAGCGNRLMVEMLDGLKDRAALFAVAGWGVNPTWAQEAAEHAAILAAAQRRDADAAGELLRRHIQKFDERVLAWLPDRPVGPPGPAVGATAPEEDPIA